MNINGSYTLKAPRETVWKMLLDREMLQRCMPGCERLEATGPDQYDVTMRIGVAAIKGTYGGKVSVTDKRAPESYALHIEGGGAPGRVRGQGRLRLEPTPDGATTVTYEGDVQVFGPVAAVGQRLLGAAAKMLADQFFKCLEEGLATQERH